jgi:hypothetical protein
MQLSGKLKDLTNIYYFSDGAALQYKNGKNLINLCYHKDDFGMDNEWHFFATSHGKGACDGIGEQLQALQERQVCKTNMRSRSRHQDNFKSGLL